MSVSTIAEQIPQAVPADEHWRLSVDQYHAMIRHGILTEDDPVELLRGLLVTRMPKSPAHSTVTERLRVALDKCLAKGWFVNSQKPITTENSEPEPDAMVVRGERTEYSQRHPRSADVALVAEVSDSSLRQDRGLKKHVYAEAGVLTYWVVNLQKKLLKSIPIQRDGAQAPIIVKGATLVWTRPLRCRATTRRSRRSPCGTS